MGYCRFRRRDPVVPFDESEACGLVSGGRVGHGGRGTRGGVSGWMFSPWPWFVVVCRVNILYCSSLSQDKKKGGIFKSNTNRSPQMGHGVTVSQA